MRLSRSIIAFGLLLAVAFACGCGSSEKAPPPASPSAATRSLYDRLGGVDAIKLVVDDFVGRAAKDPAVNFTRKGTIREWSASPENVATLKTRLVDLIGSLTGGPQKYLGRDMKSAHAGMKITAAEFNALAADLAASLDALKVPAKEKAELLAIVGTTQKDIVEAP